MHSKCQGKRWKGSGVQTALIRGGYRQLAAHQNQEKLNPFIVPLEPGVQAGDGFFVLRFDLIFDLGFVLMPLRWVSCWLRCFFLPLDPLDHSCFRF